jgi:hypothetical protein
MSDSSDRQRRLIKKLAKLVSELASEFSEGEDGLVVEPQESGSSEPAVCTPKPLPPQVQIHAARTAVSFNPLNAAALGGLRDVEAQSDVLPPARIAVDVKRYWGPAQRTLSVSFLEKTTSALRNKILSHMNSWSTAAGIVFEYTTGQGNVRITRAERGYWSYVGTDILHIKPDRATMCLQGFTEQTSESEYKRVVRHEAGHTLGFPHEHMRRELVARLDRQKCYDYFKRTQGWEPQMVDAQVLTPLDQRSIFGTQPDETSIMCYQLPGSLTKNGKPILGGLDINATDYWFAGRIYPKSSAHSSPGASLAAIQAQLNSGSALTQPELADQTDPGSDGDTQGFTAVALSL